MVDINKEDRDEELSDKLEPAQELGKEFIRQWKGAVQTKNSTTIGDYTLPELLNRLFRARDNATSCAEHKLKELYPEWATLPTSLVDFKTDILKSMIRESIADVARAPFIIDPTPEPELPESVVTEILNRAAANIEALFTIAASGAGEEPSEELLMDMLRKEKLQAKTEQKKHAREQALVVQSQLYDKTVEGGYRKAIIEFADDFALYPLAVLHGPFPTPVKTTIWKGNKFAEVTRVRWMFERVSPFDYFWTQDSADSNTGTAVFIRKQVPYDFLYNARELARDDPDSGYIAANLTELIDKAKESYIPRRWTEFYTNNPENSTNKLISVAWQHGDSIEILIRYGRFLGSVLAEMGYTGLSSDKSYETKVVMVGGHIVQCELNKNPGETPRPIFSSSFSRRTGSMVGISIGQRVLPYHEAYRAVIQLAMYNMGLSAEPVTEVDIARIAEYMPEEWDKNPTISPGMVIPADGSRVGENTPAVRFTEIPNITAQCLSLAQYIFEQAHVISNIPAALHGQPVGSGANRTVRGLLTLQGNTLKPIKSAMENLDMDVIEPMVLLMYRLLVMYDNDFEYTGDAKIIAKGAATMIEREMEKQSAMENLQILGQLGEGVDPNITNRATVRLLELAKIIEPGEDVMAAPQVQPQMPPGQAAPQPGAAQDPMAAVANPANVDMQSIPGAI